MSKLTNIMIIFLKYPLLFLTNQALKDDYRKLINIFINKIEKKTDINTIKTEINSEIEYYISMHKVLLKQDEIEYFKFLICTSIINSQKCSYIEMSQNYKFAKL